MTRKVQIILGGVFVASLFLLNCKQSSHYTSVLGNVTYPEDNLNSEEKVELGRKLFFDKRLSVDSSISCASCHVPEYAFTDRKSLAEGVKGRHTQRNSPSILNAGYLQTVMFDAHLPTLEMQVIVPIQEHVEMDMPMIDLMNRLRAIPEYQHAAKSIFGRDQFDAYVLTRSISAFERTLISDNSRFDQYYYHKKNSLSKDELAGWKLFSEKLYCTECHPAPHFTTYLAENNGLYLEYGEDKGRFRINNDSLDIGKFKVPGLRNIELTFPYMHDGSINNLTEVLDHYMNGGKGHWNQSPIIKPFELSPKEKEQIVSFLMSLTDTSYMVDYR